MEASIPVSVAASRYTVDVNSQIHTPFAKRWPRLYHHVDTEIQTWASKSILSVSLLIVISSKGKTS